MIIEANRKLFEPVCELAADWTVLIRVKQQRPAKRGDRLRGAPPCLQPIAGRPYGGGLVTHQVEAAFNFPK